MKLPARLMSGTMLLTGTATLSVPASAQEALPQPPREMQTVDGAANDIIVTGYRAEQQQTATKTPLSLKDTPQSISVATADIIADRGAQSLAEAMYFIPNVVAFNDGATGGAGGGNSFGVEYNIRGVYESGLLNFRRVNGLRTYYRATIDLSAIDRVEVLRGPASLFSGAVPPGGIINLIPKRAPETLGGSATARIGSYDAFVAEGDVGGPLIEGGGLRGRIVAKYVDEGSWVDIRKSKLWTATAAIGADLSPTTTLDVTGSFLRREFIEGGSFAIDVDGTIPDIPASRFVGLPTPPSTGEVSWIDGELRQELGGGWSLTGRARYEDGFNAQRATEFGEYVNGFAAGDVSLNLINRRYVFDSLSLDAFASGAVPLFGRDLSIVLGADHYDSDETFLAPSGARFGRISNVATINIFDPDYSIPVGPFDNDLIAYRQAGVSGWGIYGQAIVRPTARLAITLGGRKDWAESFAPGERFEVDAFTGRVAATYALTDQITAYATYNESFIPTNAQLRDGSIIDPETGYQAEVGVKASLLDDRLTATVAAYRLVRRSIATSDPRNGPDDFFVIATGEQVHKGIEAEVVGSPLRGLQIAASLALQDAEVTESNDGFEGTVPYDAQEFTGALLATYELQSGPLRGFGFGGSVRDLGKYFPFTDPQNTFSYNPPPIVDAQLFYRGFEGWDVRLNAFNIFDERYLSAVSIYSASTFGRPRSAILSVRRSF